MNLMEKTNQVTSQALDRVSEQLNGSGDTVTDGKMAGFALKALRECSVLRTAITRQVDVSVRTAVAVKANLSELRPAFELLMGASDQ